MTLEKRLRIQVRAVGRGALTTRPCANRRLERAKEPLDVGVLWGVVQHFVDETAKGAAVQDPQNGPSYNSSAAMYPEKSANAQSREPDSMTASAFSHGLNPGLRRDPGNKHPVISPEVLTGGLVGEAISDHQPDRHTKHAVGIVGVGQAHVRDIGTEVNIVFRAMMDGVCKMDVVRAARDQVLQVVNTRFVRRCR